MDLKILEKDGWEELEDFYDAKVDRDELWTLVGAGRFVEATSLLYDAGYDFEEDTNIEIWMIATPDDIVGKIYRVWVLEKEA